MDEIEEIANKLQKEIDKEIANDPLTKLSLGIVEDFLEDHRVMCYGGTAINNLLPAEDRFYDYEYDVPDYDFFSETPQEHAMMLANRLHEAGIKSVEVKPGIHLGTFKVFADYSGVADITFLEPEIFQRLWEEGITRNNVHYVTPDFLRMSMYLELSRPRGDVSRWTKVYDRLMRLNKHYPIVCKREQAEEHSKLTREMKREIKDIVKRGDAILLGVTAAEVQLRQEWTTPVMLLADKEVIEKYTKGKKVVYDEGTEILPPRHAIYEPDGSSHIRFYEATACHSYHTMPDGTRVASIPTILQFFFAYIYSRVTKENAASMLCIAQRLMDVAHSKPTRRFAILTPMDCFGKQDTLTDIRKEKAQLYEKLSKDKSSADYLRYFFTYSPNLPKTQRAKLRKQLRKTRKARSESSE